MSLSEKVASGGLWLGALSFITQLISWVFTFYVIRILNPEDFGLMTMAAFLTAYMQMFSGLGLGAAIIHRKQISEQELSSVFWLVTGIGLTMAVIALLVAYPNAMIFNDERAVPVTQLISLLFIISATSVVPRNLLIRNLEFKLIGIINLLAALTASIISVILAKNGFGAYTLVLSNIALNFVSGFFYYYFSRWRPSRHYKYVDVKPFLSYGIPLAISATLQRLLQSLDKLIVGRLYGAKDLGLYGNAESLSNMPLDKVWPIFKQISFPLLSRLQNDPEKSIQTYLKVLEGYLLLITPIFAGGAIIAHDLIYLVFGEKWVPMAPFFQAFCVAKIFESLEAFNNLFHESQGRTRWVMYYQSISLIIMLLGIYLAASHSFKALALPWLLLYPLLSITWVTISKAMAGYSVRHYLWVVLKGCTASIIMVCITLLADHIYLKNIFSDADVIQRLLSNIIIAVVFYSLFLLLFQRESLRMITRTLLKRK